MRFSDDVVEYSLAEKGCDYMHLSIPSGVGGQKNDENLEAMPLNWQVMYKGILKHKNLRGYN